MIIIGKSEKMKTGFEKLSETIVHYSLDVKPNDKVLITCTSECKPLVLKLIDAITAAGAVPIVKLGDDEIDAYSLRHTSDERIRLLADMAEFDVDHFDCFIHIRYTKNEYETKNVPAEVRRKLGEAKEHADDIRINERRWTLLNYPSVVDAYKAGMPTEEFFQYAVDVMNVDYKRMYDAILPLKELMEKTDQVRIVGPNTDISFSIKGIPAIPCCGKANIPDGEIYTAPVKESVNGTITYNTPCPYQGNIYTNVSLTFENGKIIKATCDQDNDKLNEIFDTDEGSRYVGEFSFGVNPKILDPMGDILYDEKILGSIHFTPGRAYKDAFNGNLSSVHWDMVLVQRPEYGGGEIYFDGKLIRKDGKFVLPELEALNGLQE